MSPDMRLNRADIGFLASVADIFRFLVEEHGMRLVKSDDLHSRYQSERVFLEVYHGYQSYSIGVDIGLRALTPDQKEIAYALETLEEVWVGSPDEHQHGTTAYSPPLVTKYVLEYSLRVRNLIGEILDPDSRIFDLARLRNHTAGEQWISEMKLSRIRKAADSAWQKSDYMKVEEAYEQIEREISSTVLLPSERAKLAYARKHRSDPRRQNLN